MKLLPQVIVFLVGCGFCALVPGGFAAPAGPKSANPLSGTVTGGFKFAGYDAQNRLNSLIIGESLKPVPENRSLVLISKLRLESYREDGQLEMVAEAPECLFDITTRVASSPGKLTAHTADQRLAISGEGFYFQQTNSSLVISNKVHTLIRRETTNAPATNAVMTVEKPLEVFARRFNYDMPAKLITYTDDVRVDDRQMELTSRRLLIQLAPKGGSFEQISAHEDVVISNKTDQSRATGQLAVYTRTNERVVLTGQPVWQQGLRSGSARRLIMEREQRRLTAEEEVKMKLPRESLGQGGLLGAPSTVTNQSRTNGFLELAADFFQSHSNLTFFRGNVRATNDNSRLSCGLLTLQAATKTDSNEVVTAEQDVRVEQGGARVSAQKGVYSRATGRAVFTGEPRWQMNQREGHAETLIFQTQSNYFRAVSNAYVKLQLSGSATSNSFLPALPRVGAAAGSSNAVGTASAKTNAPAAPKWVEIYADDLQFKDRQASFRQAVRVQELPADGAQARLRCDLLQVTFASQGNQAEKLAATGNVLMEKGKPGVTNGPTAYQRMQAGVLIADLTTNGVVDRVIARENVVLEETGTHARGEQAVYTQANETMVLTGQPTARTPELLITQAEGLLWNRSNNTFSASGPFQMQTLKNPLNRSNTSPDAVGNKSPVVPPP